VSDDVPNYFEAKESTLSYLKLFVKDFGLDSGISRVFQRAFEYLLSVKKAGGRVLVHCMAGQNRSVTVVAAFLMSYENLTLKEAMNQIRCTRKGACPFRDNREELVRYETSLLGFSSMTVDDFLVPELHRSVSEGSLEESSCCIMKAKCKRSVPPEFLSSSTSSITSLTMSSSSIPPPSCYNPYSGRSHSHSMSLSDLPPLPSTQKFGFPSANAKDSVIRSAPISSIASTSSTPLRRAQIIEDDSNDDNERPRLVVTV